MPEKNLVQLLVSSIVAGDELQTFFLSCTSSNPTVYRVSHSSGDWRSVAISGELPASPSCCCVLGDYLIVCGSEAAAGETSLWRIPLSGWNRSGPSVLAAKIPNVKLEAIPYPLCCSGEEKAFIFCARALTHEMYILEEVDGELSVKSRMIKVARGAEVSIGSAAYCSSGDLILGAGPTSSPMAVAMRFATSEEPQWEVLSEFPESLPSKLKRAFPLCSDSEASMCEVTPDELRVTSINPYSLAVGRSTLHSIESSELVEPHFTSGTITCCSEMGGIFFICEAAGLLRTQFKHPLRWERTEVNLVKAPVPPATELSRTRSVPARVTSTAASTVPISKILLRIQANGDSFNVRRAKAPRGGSAANLAISNADVKIEGVHPLSSQIAIDALSAPVDVRLKADYETDEDATAIQVELLDVQRLLSVKLNQTVRIGGTRKKQYAAQFEKLEQAVMQLQREQSEVQQLRDSLAETERSLNQRAEQLKEEDAALDEKRTELQRLEAQRKVAAAELEGDRLELETAKEREREAEAEAEKRRRQEREKQRQHERTMEAEKRKEEKLQQQLQEAIAAQQAECGRMEREVEKMTREREQHRRDVQWAKDKEALWNEERKRIETQNLKLKDEIQELQKANDLLSREVRDRKESEGTLKAEMVKLRSALDAARGRAPWESENEWTKRYDFNARLADACCKGRFVVPGFTVDAGSGTNNRAFVLSTDDPLPLFPTATVSVTDHTLNAGFVELEIGEGYTAGDSLILQGVDDGGQFCMEGIGPVANCVRCADAMRVNFAPVTPQVPIAKVLAAVLRAMFFDNRQVGAAIVGMRTLEMLFVLTSSTKQQTVHLPAFMKIAVAPPPLVHFKPPMPFMERTDGVRALSNMRAENPFSSKNVAEAALSWIQAMLKFGLKGPNRGESINCAMMPEPKAVGNFQQRYGFTMSRRCITCNQLRLTPPMLPEDETDRGVFASGRINIVLAKVQPEDELFIRFENEAERLSLASSVNITLSPAKDRVDLELGTMSSSMLTVALQAIEFRSTAIPLEDAPRSISYSVSLPSMKLPVKWSRSLSIPIVNCAHPVDIESAELERTYRIHVVGVNGATFEPPLLHFCSSVVVKDSFASRFSGVVTFKIVSPSADRDSLDIRPQFDSKVRLCDDGAVFYDNEKIASVEKSEDRCKITISFASRTTMSSAEAILRSVTFSTQDTAIMGTRDIEVVGALGRLHENKLLFHIVIQPCLLDIAVMGGVKWVEHQGPVLATSQLEMCNSTSSADFVLRVFVLQDSEEGDCFSVSSSISTSSLELPTTLRAACRENAADVAKSYSVFNSAVVVHELKDGSMIVQFHCDTADGGHSDLQLRVNQVLQVITFYHNTMNPKKFKKVIAARCEEVESGAYCDAYLPLLLVTVDDPTEIHHVPPQIVFCQSSPAAEDGFPLMPTAELFDPDTDDFIGGFFSVEVTTGYSPGDELLIVPPQKQLRDGATYIVFVDHDSWVYVFKSIEEMDFWEQALHRNIVFHERNDEYEHCVGKLFRFTGALGSNFSASLTLSVRRSVRFTPPTVPQGDSAAGPQKIMLAVHFVPPQQRFIPLDEVQAVLRAVGFANHCGVLRQHEKQIEVLLGAGTLSSSAEGATLADRTRITFAMTVVPAVMYTPVQPCPVQYTLGSPPMPVGREISVPYLRCLVSLPKATFVARLDGPAPRDSESLSLQLKRESGSTAALELRGHALSLAGKGPIGTLSAERGKVSIKFHNDARVDARTFQTILRSIVYQNDDTSGDAWERLVLFELQDALLPIPVGESLKAQESFVAQLSQAIEKKQCTADAKQDANEQKPSETNAPQPTDALTEAPPEGAQPADAPQPTDAPQATEGTQPTEAAQPFEGAQSADAPQSTEALQNTEGAAQPAPTQGTQPKDAPPTDAAQPTEGDQQKDTPAGTEVPQDQPKADEAPKAEGTPQERAAPLPAEQSEAPPESPTAGEAKDQEDPPTGALQSPTSFKLEFATVPPNSHFVCKMSVRGAGRQQQKDPSFQAVQDTSFALRTGTVNVFPTLTLSLSSLVLRHPSALTVSYPPSITNQVSFQEDLHMQLVPAPEPNQHIISVHGYAVARMISVSVPRGNSTLRFEMICCPAVVARDILRHIVIQSGKKDRTGMKYAFKIQLTCPIGDANALSNVVVVPPLIDELPAAQLQFTGDAIRPFAAAKLHSQNGFPAGRIEVDIFAPSDAEGGRIASSFVDLTGSSTFDVQHSETRESGTIYTGKPTAQFATFSRTAQSLVVILCDSAATQSCDTVQEFVASCITLLQPDDDRDFDVSFNVRLAIFDAKNVSCSTFVPVIGVIPSAAKTKKKSMRAGTIAVTAIGAMQPKH